MSESLHVNYLMKWCGGNHGGWNLCVLEWNDYLGNTVATLILVYPHSLGGGRKEGGGLGRGLVEFLGGCSGGCSGASLGGEQRKS
jgi:hypothetical protein